MSDGITIKVLDKPRLDLSSKIGEGILAFLSALADDERERIVKRAAGGRRAARVTGVIMGRPPVLTEHESQENRRRLAKGEKLPVNRQKFQLPLQDDSTLPELRMIGNSTSGRPARMRSDALSERGLARK
jgi:DNA invertase Pin-like site-specific DNA recombinase